MRVAVKIQNDLPLADNVLLAQLVEARGLDGIWVSEYAERDAFTYMTVLGRATERVTVGVSIVPLYTRTDVVLGMTAASLSEALPGRVRLGLGTSTKVIVEGWHGRQREAPMATARTSFGRIRAILADEQLPPLDEVSRAGFRYLHPDHVREIELHLAALGPKMTQLAGEIADAVLLNIAAPEHLATVRDLLFQGAEKAGRAASPDVIGDVRVGVSDDPATIATLRASLRKLVASYGRVPPYNAHYATSGFPEQAARIADAWERRDADAAIAAVDDEMLDRLVAVGSADEVVERIARYADHGMDEVILFPTAHDGDMTTATQQIVDIGTRLKERLA